MENRNGLIVASALTQASTNAERIAASDMMKAVKRLFGRRGRRLTIGADKAYHERDFVESMKQMKIEPHLGAYAAKRADWVGDAVRQTTRYVESQRRRKWIERCFAWIKGPAGGGKTRFRGAGRVGWSFTFAAGVLNLLRLSRLAPLDSA
jgi:hypothetical protein